VEVTILERPIEQIFQSATRLDTRIRYKQLEVSHPGDDDGLWFFWLEGRADKIQLESSSGEFPFIFETDEHSKMVHNVDEATTAISDWIHINR